MTTVFYTKDDFRIFERDWRQWLSELTDPHEFATSFVNWIEENPWAKGNIFPALQALDHWEIHGTLEGL